MQKHFPEMFANTKGSLSNVEKSPSELLLEKLISFSRNPENTVELEQAQELTYITNTPLFVDVRSPDQYNAKHITGAVNIPVNELAKGHADLPGDVHAPIITVCNRGNMSLSGMLVLKSLGYQNVKSLNGGTIGWMDKGYSVT